MALKVEFSHPSLLAILFVFLFLNVVPVAAFGAGNIGRIPGLIKPVPR